MLQMVFGRSGFGKTEWMLNEIGRLIRAGEDRILLLIPEQFSFEMEKELLERLGPRDAMKVEAYSFTRLAESVFRRVGGLCGERLDDGGKAVLMSRALESLGDELSVFTKSAQDISFVTVLLSAVTEWKQACVTPEQLLTAAGQVERPALAEKMRETALIYAVYEALVQVSYLDPLDVLTRLAEALRVHRALEGYTLFIDAFRSFTGQELLVLEALLQQCKSVSVGLCMDSLDTKGLGLFYPVEETARRLMRMARQHGIPVSAPVKLTEGHRFHSPALSTLEHCAYRNLNGTDLADTPDVEVFSAANAYEEADIVAERIHKMVRTRGLRYGDFAVIARSAESYRGIIDAALEKYNVPYYLSKPERIEAKPLFVLVFSVLRVLCGGYQSDDVFRYLKTGLSGLSVEAVSELENYTLVWRKNGAQWKEEWRDHPRGFAPERTADDEERLRRINASREQAVQPIERLGTHMKDADATAMTEALYNFLIETGTGRQLKDFEKKLMDAGLPDLAQEQPRLWDVLMACLDQMVRTAGDAPLSIKKYLDLFTMLAAARDISFIPKRKDSVIVGSADTIRAGTCKYVFLLGANEGVFPQSGQVQGLFSDFEREAIIQAGLPLTSVREMAAAEERMYAYSAMTAASDGLSVTYARMTVSGEPLYPSSIVTEIRRIFRALAVHDRMLGRARSEAVEDWVEASAPAFEWTAMHWREDREPFITLRDHFARELDYRDKVKAIERAVARSPFSLSDGAAQTLFGKHMTLSATRVDTYAQCPFHYFAQYGLNARPREAAEIDPLAFGSVIHYVLEHAVRDGRGNPAGYRREADAHARALVTRYVEENMGGGEDKTARFSYLREKLVRTARDLIDHAMREIEQSAFVPADFELPIGGEEGIPFPALPLPGGGSVSLTGKVDRVDCMEREGKTWLRILDYKTGATKFALWEVLGGLNLQMLLYLMCIVKNGGARYGEMIPAGVLYMPASRKGFSAARGIGEEKVQAEQDKGLTMNGLLLNDPAVLQGMEADLSGRFIPAALKKGTLSGNSLADAEDFSRLFVRVERTLGEMACALHEGKIEAVPTLEACDWCHYRTVCKRERGDPVRRIVKLDTREALNALREEEEGNGTYMD